MAKLTHSRTFFSEKGTLRIQHRIVLLRNCCAFSRQTSKNAVLLGNSLTPWHGNVHTRWQVPDSCQTETRFSQHKTCFIPLALFYGRWASVKMTHYVYNESRSHVRRTVIDVIATKVFKTNIDQPTHTHIKFTRQACWLGNSLTHWHGKGSIYKRVRPRFNLVW